MWGTNQSRPWTPANPAAHGLCRLGELLPAVLEKYGVDRAGPGLAADDIVEWEEPTACRLPELAAV